MLTCCLAVYALGACAPQLQVVLSRADDLNGSPPFLRFEVLQLGANEAQRMGPFLPSAVPDELFTEIPPDAQRYIDVIGCQAADADKCAAPEQFVARGCSGYFVLPRDEQQKLVIELHKPDEGAKRCPPAAPSS